MQLTRFDRWLLEHFVYETHVKTLRVPESIPRKIRVQELPDAPGKRFHYLFIIRSNKTADTFIASLKDANLMFSTTVVNRNAWFVPLIAPKGKSLSWRITWIVLACISGYYVTSYLISLFSQPELRKMIAESIEMLKH